MSKLLYFTATQIDCGKFDGVAKKVVSQCRAFEVSFGAGNVYLASFCGSGYAVRKIGEEKTDYSRLDIGDSKQRKMRLKAVYPQLLDWILSNGIDSVYFRSPGLDTFTHSLFRRLAAAGVTIILEIPTWPFWEEKRKEVADALRHCPVQGAFKAAGAAGYWLETKRLKGLVDSIVTFSDVKEIWGLPAYGISNGYDFDAVPLLEHDECHEELRFVVAATLRRNHGIDRMIRAVAAYDGETSITFHIAGEGDASDELRLLAEELGVMGDSVFFHGYLYGAELEELYTECDVGVSALGFHRYGVANCSPLKSKEYLAHGMPCLGTTSERDIIESPASAYFYPAPSSEDAIDLNRAVEYFTDLRERGVTREEVRTISKNYFDWRAIMRPIGERFLQAVRKRAADEG